jgi:hypothetical protein
LNELDIAKVSRVLGTEGCDNDRFRECMIEFSVFGAIDAGLGDNACEGEFQREGVLGGEVG